MNLAGGEKRSETSEIIEITVASTTERDVRMTLEVTPSELTPSSKKTNFKLRRGTPTARKWTNLAVKDLQICLATNRIKKKTSLPSRKETRLAYWMASPKEAA